MARCVSLSHDNKKDLYGKRGPMYFPTIKLSDYLKLKCTFISILHALKLFEFDNWTTCKQKKAMSDFAIRSYSSLYAAMDAKLQAERDEHTRKTKLRNAIQTSFISAANTSIANSSSNNVSKGFKRIDLCRTALNALDRRGWERSYHQRYFHNQFIRACARVFWKTEPEGQFAKDHQKILELNG